MAVQIASPIPELPVRDVAETQRFYRNTLGFQIDWAWGENDYGSVSLDGATIYFLATTGPLPRAVHVLNVGDVDALHAKWTAAGADIAAAPEDKPWGIREFTVRDCNGHTFRVSQPSTTYNRPAHVAARPFKIVERLPSPKEYSDLVTAVNWTGFTNLEAGCASLPQSRFCVVAEIDKVFVGLTRIIGDGQQFFYVMDVAVLPEHQGRGIGTALMDAAIAFIQRTAPEKALVGLYTGAARASFYRRFGFKGPDTGLYGMSALTLHPAGS